MKHTIPQFTVLLLTPLVAMQAGAGDSLQLDLALQPAQVIVSPQPLHIPPTKRQGVPGIERTANGRLWVIYGRNVESTRTYQVLKTSNDDGRSWSAVKLMILPHEGTRAMSANVWIDPLGRLWLFWGQSANMQDGRFGVWAIVADDPEAAEPQWSAPRRLGDGILLNKPTVLKNGDWLLPASVWKADNSCRVLASADQGKTFQLRGTAHIADPKKRGPDEEMIVERQDGSLWMLVRVQGLGESISNDGGKTWSPVERSTIKHNTSRFFLRRLHSGSLLLVKHGPLDKRTKREQLTAYISDDDGKTWQGGLMIDERPDVTYPDGVQAADGTIYLVYDYRRTPEGVIHMATFREDDVRAGKQVTNKVRLRVLVDRLPPTRSDDVMNQHRPWTEDDRRVADDVSSYWVNFVKTGNPNGGSPPRWQPFDGGNPSTMALSTRPRPRPVAGNEKLAFYRDLFEK